jgi:NAD-dependent SIR2 family protein deacetylase
MNPLVADLASLIRAKKADEQRFVVLLGAGASMSSGVKSTPQIMAELLGEHGKSIEGTSVPDRFDKLWKGTTDSSRALFLSAYLADCRKQTPSSGYNKLAQLIDRGYFNLVVTFNFDTLLETALGNIGFKPEQVKPIIRGETQDEEMEKLVDARDPRVKIVKLHGSLRSSDHFLFSAEEMLRYPEPLALLFNKITRNDVLLCGYAFNDHCVLSTFAQQGGSVVCVDPTGAPTNLRFFMTNRRSENWAIRMKFDDFFDELHRALLQPAAAAPKPLLNPFKFLESYEETDAGSLMKREEETETFLGGLKREPLPQLIVVAGPGRAGKTSLVKAALLPALDSQKYQGIYIRCQPEMELAKSLPRDLSRFVPGTENLDLPSSLKRLGQASPGRRVVLFLDQFDRVTGQYNLRESSKVKELAAFLRDQLFKGCNDNLTLVLVVTAESPGAIRVSQECANQGLPAFFMDCPAFDRGAVVAIIQALAEKGEIEFDPRIVADLADLYEQSKDASAPETRFTLAHIQAVCHILAGTRRVEYDSYTRAFERTQAALHQAINVCEIISFVEDFAWQDAAWLRNIIKVPLKQSLDQIAYFITKNYGDLVPQPGRGAAGGQGAPRAGQA